jgi:hypothetical protein
MVDRYPLRALDDAAPDAVRETLEASGVVYFEKSPVSLPSDEDLVFLRETLPSQHRVKNISYHPESDSIPRFDAGPDVQERVKAILKAHRENVAAFFTQAVPAWVPNWTVGTTSFRSAEERGRDLKPRSSNEIVHIDAGAYGATNGNRVQRVALVI